MPANLISCNELLWSGLDRCWSISVLFLAQNDGFCFPYFLGNRGWAIRQLKRPLVQTVNHSHVSYKGLIGNEQFLLFVRDSLLWSKANMLTQNLEWSEVLPSSYFAHTHVWFFINNSSAKGASHSLKHYYYFVSIKSSNRAFFLQYRKCPHKWLHAIGY